MCPIRPQSPKDVVVSLGHHGEGKKAKECRVTPFPFPFPVPPRMMGSHSVLGRALLAEDDALPREALFTSLPCASI
ncbi:hypothetical protein OPV22_024076 [Ensete ventricosum]|uniref:Uncharacterized protein n=1 Tax=Ensete ventricosum TaxID=4639 RepID=A0AAV8QJI9_ENSVE|nr:hypothetical protein OPV22_024076 [Ensete ventricosum]